MLFDFIAKTKLQYKQKIVLSLWPLMTTVKWAAEFPNVNVLHLCELGSEIKYQIQLGQPQGKV